MAQARGAARYQPLLAPRARYLLLLLAGLVVAVTAKEIVIGEAELVAFMKKAVVDQKREWMAEVRELMGSRSDVNIELKQENQELRARILEVDQRNLELEKLLQAFIQGHAGPKETASTAAALAPRRATEEEGAVAEAISDA